MKRTAIAVAALGMLLLAPAGAIVMINNFEIFKMTREKVPPEAIIDTIHKSQCDFDLRPANVKMLIQAGVQPEVIQAMKDAMGQAGTNKKQPEPMDKTFSATVSAGLVQAQMTVTKGINQMDGQHWVELHIPSQNVYEEFLGNHVRPDLIVSCREKKVIGVFVAPGLDVEVPTATCPWVFWRLRTEAGNPSYREWSKDKSIFRYFGKDEQGKMHPTTAFLKELFGARKLYIEFRPATRNQEFVAEFDLTGLSGTLGQQVECPQDAAQLHFPIHLEVQAVKCRPRWNWCEGWREHLSYQVDDGEIRDEFVSDSTPQPFLTLDANSSIRIWVKESSTMKQLSFKLNGQVAEPEWRHDKQSQHTAIFQNSEVRR